MGYLGTRVAEPIPAGWVSPEVIEELEAHQRMFRSDSPVVLVLECDDFFQPERVGALHAAVEALRRHKAMLNLSWVGDLPEVTLLGRKRMLLPSSDDVDEESLAKAKQELLQHPLASGNLLSADGSTFLVLMDVEQSRTDGLKNSRIVEEIRQITEQHLKKFDIQTQVTGTLALYATQAKTLTEDNFRIQFMAYCIVGILQILIFRKPVAIVISCAGPVVGVIWTIGWLNLLGQQSNELAKIILPVLVIMIGFTDGVHLMVRLKQLRATGVSVKEAVRESMLQIGPACFLTSVTTAIGFGSLGLSNSEMIAGFGLVSAIGVTVTFLAVIMVSPLLAVSGLGEHMAVSGQSEPLSQVLNRFTGVIAFSSRHAKTVSIVGVLITAVCLGTCARLVPDDRVSDRVPPRSESFLAMQHCDQHVGGIRTVHFMISWPDGTLRDDIWKAIRDCEAVLKDQPELSPPLSIRSALSVIRGRHRPDQSVLANRLPDNLRDRYYRPKERIALVTSRTQDLGFAAFDPMFQKINSELTRLNDRHSGFEIQLVSNVILEGRVVSQMIGEMLTSLAWAAIIIFGVLAIAFRSLRIGLISIVPNVMPLAVSGAVRYVFGDSVGIAGTCSLAICLGIAVDDTIHYLNHFRLDRSRGLSPLESNRSTFVAVGSALLLTTIVMSAGLGTVMTSNLPPQVNFASMACVTLLVALPADLIFLPALLTLFPGNATASKTEVAPESV